MQYQAKQKSLEKSLFEKDIKKIFEKIIYEINTSQTFSFNEIVDKIKTEIKRSNIDLNKNELNHIIERIKNLIEKKKNKILKK